MKRLIVKYNSIFREEERMEIEVKIRREWEERKAVFIPEGCDYEIIDDGVNEAAIWLDQEIEKRKAAVEAPKAAVKEFCDNINDTYDEVDQFICSECGIELQDWKRIERDMNFKNEIDIHEYILKFCPNCGRKIRSTQ